MGEFCNIFFLPLFHDPIQVCFEDDLPVTLFIDLFESLALPHYQFFSHWRRRCP